MTGYSLESRVKLFGQSEARLASVHITKTILLCIALFLLWQTVFYLINWYDLRMHMFATFSSAAMIGLSDGTGIITKILD